MTNDDDTLYCKLVPARISDLTAQHMPTLPAWYPLDREPKRDESGEIVETFPPYTFEQRRAIREQRRITEATAGPYDGLILALELEPGQSPPRKWVNPKTPLVDYIFDERASTPQQVIYRYNVNNPLHADFMRAVEQGFTEAGRDYAIAAREETDHERTAPEL